MPKFQVSRSIQIDTSPESVFNTVSDFGTWTTWSPWLCAEPDAKVTVSEDSNSVGSLYSWDGNLVGAGEIEHRKLEPGKYIEEEIRFTKPWKSQSKVTFELEPVGESTKITWNMYGSLPFFMFWMKGMMEALIGMDYDRGLKMLKEHIETGQILSTTKIVGTKSIGPLSMVGVRGKSALKDIGPTMESMIGQAIDKMSQLGIPTEGEMISVYHDFVMKTETFDFSTGFVVNEIPESVAGAGLSSWSIPQVNALRVDHIGSYQNLGNPWSAANQYARYKKMKMSKVGAFELYKNSPEDTAPADLLTEIYLPLK